jgi:hypothetical protein
MAIKVTVEGDLEEMKEAFGYELFDWGLDEKEEVEETITSLETTSEREEGDLGPYDHYIIGFKEEERPENSWYSDLTLLYRMGREQDLDKVREYRVPKTSLDFILEAEKKNLLVAGKVVWVTLRNRNKAGTRQEWIRITK